MKKLFWTSLVIIIIFSGNACHKSSPETLIGNWVQKSTFDGNARSGAVGFCIGNNFYLGFGIDGRNIYVQDFWKYNSETNSWIALSKPCPGVGRLYAVGFSIGNDGYVGSGQDKDFNYLRDFWKYQSDLDQWVIVDSLPVGYGRTGAVSFSLNQKGYVGTGFNGSYLKDFYVYDPTLPVKSQWTLVPGFGGDKRRNGVAFVIGGKAYVCTGFNGTGIPVTDLWRFDPATQTWVGGIENGLRPISATTNSNYKIVRSNAVGFSTNDKGYIALGNSPSLSNDVWEYDPTSDTWGRKTNFEGAARTNAVAFSLNNRIFVTSGQSSSYQFDDLWEFKPADAYNAND